MMQNSSVCENAKLQCLRKLGQKFTNDETVSLTEYRGVQKVTALFVTPMSLKINDGFNCNCKNIGRITMFLGALERSGSLVQSIFPNMDDLGDGFAYSA